MSRLGKHMGEKTREGVESVVGLLEWLKRGGGIKVLDDKSIGMEILMSEDFAKIKPTDPLILDRHTAWRKRKWPDSSGMSCVNCNRYKDDGVRSVNVQIMNNLFPIHYLYDPSCVSWILEWLDRS
jgi:hypothetical protein